MVANPIAAPTTAGSTLALGQEIWIKVEPDRAEIVRVTPNVWVGVKVVEFCHGSYVVEGAALPTENVIRCLLQEIGGEWRFWVETSTANHTSLASVRDSNSKEIAARRPTSPCHNPLLNGHW